ncbi:MAG TPA: methyltransferase domain-containing protein [Candidatus Paceibacterota bacterium]|nr:methyltransferase domain-containing protein [Candidatus Paceibacterota bacterium]
MKKFFLAPARFVFLRAYRSDSLRKLLLRFFVQLHYRSYLFLKKLVIPYGGSHPKHEMLRYDLFFTGNISSTDRVLDIGCSTGSMAAKLAGQAKDVVGIDIIAKDIEKAKKLHPEKNLTFIAGDATTYPFEKKFDTITLSNVLEHIDKRDEFLKKISKLAPKILVRVPLATREWLAFYLRENGYEYRLDPTHFTEYTEEEIRDELERAGFHVTSFFVKWGEWYGVCIQQKK